MQTKRQFRVVVTSKPRRSTESTVMLADGLVEVGVVGDQQYVESNPDLRVVSARQSFWSHLEVEFKLEAHATSWRCIEVLQTFRPRLYSLSPPWRRVSYERYRSYSCATGTNFYVAVLGKRGGRLRRAIKYKIAQPHSYPDGFHVREVTIAPFSEAAARRAASAHLSCDSLLNVRHLPTYYSHKTRRVVVHSELGLVYCVSFTKAQPLSRRLPSRSQFEIEYWSRLLPAAAPLASGSHTLYEREFGALVHAFQRHLRSAALPASPSNVTRAQWLEGLSYARTRTD